MIELEFLIAAFVVLYVFILGIIIYQMAEITSIKPVPKMKSPRKKKLVIPAADPPEPVLLLEVKRKKPRFPKGKMVDSSGRVIKGKK